MADFLKWPQIASFELINAKVLFTQGNPWLGPRTSDQNRLDCRELKFHGCQSVVRLEVTTAQLGRKGFAEVAYRYADFIEGELWHHIDAKRAA